LRQSGENCPPRGVGDRSKNLVQNLNSIFNHSVEYRLEQGACQAFDM
jgi:hypothetical protein